LKRKIFTLFLATIFLFSMSLTVHAKHSPKPDPKGKPIKCEGKGAPDEECFFYGDARADAPELAYRGSFDVGVRTVKVVNPNQIDILNYSPENPDPRYDRPLTLEVWYPAKDRGKKKEVTTYQDVLGSGPGNPERPLIPFEFAGRALRNAKPNSKEGPYPLVIVSHGYPGSRVLMTYLTENLASKGYVVVAIDHTDSTHADATSFSSTLLNRALDINFVIEDMAQRGASKGKHFLAGTVNAEKTAVIGYSMGGYGALIAAGAGVSEYGWVYWGGVPGNYMEKFRAGSPTYAALLDPRIKAIVPFAPWGGHIGTWDTAGLAGIKVPSLFIVGDMDGTADYGGVAFLFEKAVSSDRYMLVYQNGIHEVAVNPPPPIAENHFREYMHYQEPAWDNRRCNNINQHFITAFLGIHLKGMDEYQPYLNLITFSNDASSDDDDYWHGFKDWTAVGLELRHIEP
jgi:predicted dienelactone hydrolase